MNVVKLPLSQIKRPERNVRIHTEKQLKEFARSIEMFGQIRPIVIDETNTILAGVGCYETLLRLERTEGEFFKIEGLTENQKMKLMIAYNKVFGLGIDDLDSFNAILEELRQDLDIPGYDESILKSMVAEAEEVTQKINEYGTITPNDIAGMESGRQKKEDMMFAPPPAPKEDAAESPTEPTADEPPDIRRSVTCPGCGATVWL